MAARVLIVDDNAQFLQAARGLLELQGMTVVAVASTAHDARRHVAESRPEVVLIDVDLGDESGIDLAHALAGGDGGDGFRIILISAYAPEDVIDLVDTCPAVGLISKSSLSAAAIEALLAGGGSP